MPRKTKSKQLQQEHNIDNYKSLSYYKELQIKPDELDIKLREIYQNNIWDLENRFEELRLYYGDIGVSPTIAWEEMIQYLDLKNIPPYRKVSLKALIDGEYSKVGTEGKENNIKTEQGYGNRIKFYTKTFADFQKYKDTDDISWVLTDNRLLLFNIMDYHNRNNHSLPTLENELTTIVRVIKLILINPDHEIRWKYSVLQMALSGINKYKDNLNQIISVNELRSFIPYEILLDEVDKLEAKYKQSIGRVSIDNELQLNQILLAVSLMVLDFPSRLDKFSLEIITDIKQIVKGKCYILLTNPITFIFNNDKKKHKPISYQLLSRGLLSGLNKRLNEMILDSISNYPRKSLFVAKDSYRSRQPTAVKEAAVAGWIRDIIPNKTLNVGTFRSSFVSYYYPRMNNMEKTLMIYRMRTSALIINRSYLKYYTNPNTLAIVKPEPTEELLNRAKSGRMDNPIIVKQEPILEEYSIIPTSSYQQPIIQDTISSISIQERRRLNAKEWYINNREKHLARTNELNKKPETYRKRYIRDLNTGMMDISKMKKETIDKYGIKYDKNKNLYY